MMSEAQKRIFITEQVQDWGVSYNVPIVLEGKGLIQADQLLTALSQLAENHDVLRTTFAYENDKYLQIIKSSIDIDFEVAHDVLSIEEAYHNFVRPFDLTEGPLFRSKLFLIDESRSVIMVDFHHIIFDGGSVQPFFKELTQLYQGEEVLRSNVQYIHYASWKQNLDLTKQEAFWLEQFPEAPQALELPYDYQRKSTRSYEGGLVREQLDLETKGAIKALCEEYRTTEFIVMLTALSILLSRYGYQKEFAIGTVVAGRNHPQVEQLIGMFVNVLLMKCQINDEATIEHYLTEMKRMFLLSLEHQDYPFENLVEAIGHSDPSRNPLFDTMFALESGDTPTWQLGDVRLKQMEMPITISKFDSMLSAKETDSGYELNWVYCTELFKENTMRQLLIHYKNLLKEMVTNVHAKVGSLNIIDEQEKQLLLESFNRSQPATIKEKTAIQLFEAQVVKFPNQVAVAFKNEQITYQELNERANALGQQLRALGVKPNDYVAIMADRSIEMMVGMMGILKAGGAYVPLDPTYPKERLRYIFDDCGPKALLTNLKQINEESIPIVQLDDPLTAVEENLLHLNQSEDLIYAIYTSGTTGKPKGVMIEHRNVLDLTQWQQATGEYSEKTTVLQNFNYIFDGSVWEIFPALLSGCTLEIIPEEARYDPEKLLNLIPDKQIMMVPSLFKAMVDYAVENGLTEQLHSFDKLYMGGEALPYDLINRYRNMPGSNINNVFNAYGPTETTVCATCHHFDQVHNRVLIGKPTGNTQVYILSDRKLCGVGMIGELCAGGEGVARGYLNRPDLTAQKFIENPFGAGRLYRTGDLGRWLPDGNIEYLGRIDEQVKIRGFRIELGDIENGLRKIADIQDAVVIVREQGDSKTLCGYFIAQETLEIPRIKSQLEQILPEYMMPTYLMQVTTFPKTKSGKLDKQALPEPSDQICETTVVAPKTPAEIAIVNVFEEVLGLKTAIGIDDSFFALGGDSIKAIRIVSKLREKGFQIDVKAIMQLKTPRNIGMQMEETAEIFIDQREIVGPAAFTPVQKDFTRNADEKNHHFNQSVLFESRNKLDKATLIKILNAVIRHHDMLRAIYPPTGQEIKPFKENECFEFYEYDYRELDDGALAKQIEEDCQAIQTSINLEIGPLVKVGFFSSQDKDYLLLCIHHLVIDGVSWRILAEDLANGYEQAEKGKSIVLPPKTHSFQDWSGALRRYRESSRLKKELTYWQGVEADAILGNLAYDGSDKKGPRQRERLVLAIPADQTTGLLYKAGNAYQMTMNDLLLTAVVRGIACVTGQKTVAVNMEGHGREPIGEDMIIDRTIGWFTSVYPVAVTNIGGNLADDICYVKETLRKIPNHGLGYGVLKSLGEKVLEGVTPAVTFNYLGEFVSDQEEGKFAFSSFSRGNDVADTHSFGTDISIDSIISGGELKVTITYDISNYTLDFISQIRDEMNNQLVAILDHCLSVERPKYTASDFGETGWSHEAFKKVMEKFADQGYEIERILPLTGMQEGMLYHKLLNRESSEYVVQTVFKIQDVVSEEKLTQSFELLMKKHQVLRTSVVHKDISDPRQVILKERALAYTYIDLFEVAQSEEKMNKICKQDIARGFDLEDDSLIRFTLIRLAPQDYRLIMSLHHIIMDGWCTSIILNDIMSFYDQLSAGKTKIELLDQLPKEHDYADYVSYIKNKDHDLSLDYWDNLLDGYEGEGVIPPLGIVDPKNQEKVAEVETSLTEEETGKLETLSKKYSVTLNILLEAVWGMILQRYNHQQDVVFGKVVSGRDVNLPGIEEMVGLFINTIPVRVALNPEMTFAKLITELQDQALKSGEHDYCSLAEIQKLNTLGSQLIGTTLAFENYFVQEQESSKSRLNLQLEDSREETNFDLTIMAYKADKLMFKLMYNPNKYGKVEAERILANLEAILREIAVKPEARVQEINMITEKERALILTGFNDTYREYPKDKTVVELFEAQVRKTPDQIAVISEKEKMTYKELNECANGLAAKLRNLGIKPDDYVAIMNEKNVEMIVGICGILKAGAAYVPLDSTYPEERINYILQDCQPKALLTYQDQIKVKIDIPMIDLKDKNLYTDDLDHLAVVNEPTHLIYLMYTSGTTGNPKAVMIEHKNVTSLVKNTNYIDFTNATIGQAGSLSFDAATFEIWGALLNGGKLVLIDTEILLDYEKLEHCIKNHQITMMWLTSAVFNQIVQDAPKVFDELSSLLIGGEKLSDNHVRAFKKYNLKLSLINGFGPTENTTFTTTYEIPADFQRIPIGKPLSNRQVYILNGLNLCGIGVIGELFTAGDGVGRGYLNAPELTKEKFIDNPFGNGKLYRTGDLARWLPDGNLEYLGRIDDQVKIRGFRIELGEIETRIKAIEGILDAAVIIKEKDGDKFICGYFVPQQELDPSWVRDQLERDLPEYMMPAYLMQLSTFPKTKTGKLDKRGLPEPVIEVKNDRLVAPETEVECIIVEVFKEVLGIKVDIGIDESFFSLGGDSIKAIRVVAKLKEAGFDVGVKEMMQYRTARKIGNRIENMKMSNFDQGEVMRRGDGVDVVLSDFDQGEQVSIFDQINVFPFGGIENQYVASIAQKFYFQLDTVVLIFDQFVLEGAFEEQDIVQALVGVIGENGVLRSSYGEEDGAYILYEHQLFSDYLPPYFDLRSMSAAGKAAIFGMLGDQQRWKSYFTAGTWMSRFVVLREADEIYRVVFAVHHAVWDKMSSLVLEEQVQSVLDGKVATSTLPYAQYVATLNKGLIDREVQRVKDDFVALVAAYGKEVAGNSILKLETCLIKLPRELYENYHQLDIWDFLICIARVIAQENGLLTEKIAEIPVQVVQEGRSKLAADYSQSLGLFADFAPISIGCEVDQEQGAVTQRIRHLDQLKKKHNLLWQELFGAYSNELESVLLINYLGVYDIDFAQVKQELANNPDAISREITVTLHDDHLSVIYPVFSNASNEFQKKLHETMDAYQIKASPFLDDLAV